MSTNQEQRDNDARQRDAAAGGMTEREITSAPGKSAGASFVEEGEKLIICDFLTCMLDAYIF